MGLLSLATLRGEPLVLLLITIIILGLGATLKIRLLQLLRELKPFFLLLFLVFVSRSITTEGEKVMDLFGIGATRQGIFEGAIISWKFFLVMMLGILFSKSTKPSHVKGAVQWFLKPIPLVPEKRVAVMISLFLRFMPMILNQAFEVSQAQKARCSSLEKNPVKGMLNLAGPLLKKTFQSAEKLTLAMEARCYSDERTDPVFIHSGHEIKSALLSFIILGLSLMI